MTVVVLVSLWWRFFSLFFALLFASWPPLASSPPPPSTSMLFLILILHHYLLLLPLSLPLSLFLLLTPHSSNPGTLPITPPFCFFAYYASEQRWCLILLVMIKKPRNFCKNGRFFIVKIRFLRYPFLLGNAIFCFCFLFFSNVLFWDTLFCWIADINDKGLFCLCLTL